MKKYIFVVSSILMTFLIWGNSMLSVSDSNALSFGLVHRIAELVRVCGINITLQELNHIIRKCAHFTEYAVQGALVTMLLEAKGKSWKYALVMGLITAIIDETVQMFVPGRSGQVTDVLLDWFGCWFGISIVKAFNSKKKHLG